MLSPAETEFLKATASLPRDEDGLLAELGLRTILIRKQPSIAEKLVNNVSRHTIPMPPIKELKKIGQQVLDAWNRELYKFTCLEKTEDEQEKKRLVTAIIGKDVTASAILTGILISAHLSPFAAPVVAELIVKLLVVPAERTLCDFWKEKLPA